MSCCPWLLLLICIESSKEQNTSFHKWCVTIAVGSSEHLLHVHYCTKDTSCEVLFPAHASLIFHCHLHLLRVLSSPCRERRRHQGIWVRITRGEYISSLLFLPMCTSSSGAMLMVHCKNVYMDGLLHQTMRNKSLLYNFSIIQIFEMHNIRLHLYFVPLREIFFFQNHNDSYYRRSLTNTLYRNTALPLPLIFR